MCGAGRQAGSAGIIGPCCGNSSGKAGEGARRRRCLYRHPGPPVLQRNVQMYNRLPDYQLVRLAVTLLVGFIFGSLAWGQGDNS